MANQGPAAAHFEVSGKVPVGRAFGARDAEVVVERVEHLRAEPLPAPADIPLEVADLARAGDRIGAASRCTVEVHRRLGTVAGSVSAGVVVVNGADVETDIA